MAATRLRVVSWNIRAAIGPGPFPDRWWDRIDADHPAAGVRYADAPPTIREPRCLLLTDLDGWRIGTTHFGDRAPALLVAEVATSFDVREVAR